MLLIDETSGYWCYTLLQQVTTKLRYVPNQIRPLTEIATVFHFGGELKPAGANLMEMDMEFYYVSKVKVNLKAILLSPEMGYECTNDYVQKCIDDNVKESNCSLPFDKIYPDKPVCSNYDDGMKVVKEILSITNKCKDFCIQLSVDYNEDIPNYLLSNIKPKISLAYSREKDKKFSKGYVFTLPDTVKYYTSSHEYTAPVALGYIGSLAGVFTGISILGLLQLFTDNRVVAERIYKWLLISVKTIMVIYLLYIFVLLLLKYLENPQDTSVEISDSTSDFSISVCRIEYVYGLKKFRREAKVSQDMYLPKNDSFWSDLKNISKALNTMVLSNGTHMINLLSEKKLSEIKFYIFPIDNLTVSACFSFDLSNYTNIMTIDLYHTSEIQFYMHNNNQLVYEWIKENNKIIAVDKDNSAIYGYFDESKLKVYHTFINVKIGIRSNENKVEKKPYDHCYIDYLQNIFNPEVLNCFHSVHETNMCTEINSTTLDLVNNLLNEEGKCNLPSSMLKIQYYKQNMMQNMIFDNDYNEISKFKFETLESILKKTGEIMRTKIHFHSKMKFLKVIFNFHILILILSFNLCNISCISR